MQIDDNPEYNNYPIDIQTKSLSVDGQIQVNAPAQVLSDTNIIYKGDGSILKGGFIKSSNYVQGKSGWSLNADGTVDFPG